MKQHRHTLRTGFLIMGFLGWVWLDAGTIEAAVITIPANPPTAGAPTLTILDQDSGADITATWLPEPGQTVSIRASDGSSWTLDSATTAYPGVCTNYDTTTPEGSNPDFSPNGDLLISKDCGGTAVLRIGAVTFKVPADANNNGIADLWEAARGGNLTPGSDDDQSPSVTEAEQPPGNRRRGDGIATIDEYRGFIVSSSDRTSGAPYAGLANTKHIRTEPNQKDLFVHVVNGLTGLCAGTGAPLGRFTRYFPAGGAELFEAAQTIVSSTGTQIHYLDFTPGVVNPIRSALWVDFFDTYLVTAVGGLVKEIFRNPPLTGAQTMTEPPTDRQINKYATVPITDLITNSSIQKGNRVIECLDTTVSPTLLGITNAGTPNKAAATAAKNTGNSVVFTERIRKDVNTKLTAAGTKTVQFATSTTGGTAGWTAAAALPAALNTLQLKEDYLTTEYLQYLVGHELGHGTRLRPAVRYTMGTVSVTNGSRTVTVTGASSGAQGVVNAKSFTVDRAGEKLYSISARTPASGQSLTSVTLSANYTGATGSGLPYMILTDTTAHVTDQASMMDATIKATSGTNTYTFYIPSRFLTNDQKVFQLNDCGPNEATGCPNPP